MVNTETTLFISLLRLAMGWGGEVPAAADADTLASVWRTAQRQDVAHLVAEAAQQHGLLPVDSPLAAEALRLTGLALYRYEQQNYALSEVSQALETAQIPYLPLKGTVLRQWYPAPWMRTGSDLDILVPSEQVERACAVLCDQLGYRRGRQGAHDISLFSPTQVHIELHHRLVEEGRAGESARILATVWEQARPAEAGGYRYVMEDSLFYFYHIAHMAKHMESGGCGVRFFLDLWVLEQQPHDRAQRDSLLQQGNLLRFADACRRLAACWFGDAQEDDTTRLLQAYILGGGVYGSAANQAAAARNRQGSGVGYLVSRVFPSRQALMYDYPILQKHPYQLPLCWVRRWLRALREGRLCRTRKLLSAAERQAASTADLFRLIGLQ